MYAGCVSGAIDMDTYLEIIKGAGFSNTVVHKLKKVELPEEILTNYLTDEEIHQFKKDEIGIFSITVSAKK